MSGVSEVLKRLESKSRPVEYQAKISLPVKIEPYESREVKRADIGHRFEWPVAVTTAPRKQATLLKSLVSIENAGFNRPVVMCDGIGLPVGEWEYVTRNQRIGGWPNWLSALRELLDRHPKKPAYAIIQDDVIFVNHAAEYIEQTAPEGILNLSTSDKYAGVIGDKWQHIPQPHDNMLGALGLIIPRDIALQIVSDEWIQRYRWEPMRNLNATQHIDTIIGTWAANNKIPVWVHSPSLSGHIGTTSAMGDSHNDSNNRRRRITSFIGESWDARNWLQDTLALRTVNETIAKLPSPVSKRLPIPRYIKPSEET